MIPRPSRSGPALDLAARRDEQLAVERVRQGDALALEMIFSVFREELVALARRTLGSPALAEEVVQDVFLAVWTGRQHWHVRTSLRAYLRRAVHNVSARTGASRSRGWSGSLALDAAQRAAPADFADASRPPDIHAEHAALADAVDQATRTLPPRARDVFTLSRVRDLSNREIAEELGVSVKTVETHMTRALSLLRKQLTGWRG